MRCFGVSSWGDQVGTIARSHIFLAERLRNFLRSGRPRTVLPRGRGVRACTRILNNMDTVLIGRVGVAWWREIEHVNAPVSGNAQGGAVRKPGAPRQRAVSAYFGQAPGLNVSRWRCPDPDCPIEAGGGEPGAIRGNRHPGHPAGV